MDALELFLRMHAVVHSRGVATPDGGWSLLEAVLHKATDADLRATPMDMSSIAWLLWHTARIEDVAANVVIARRPQVLDEGGWAGQMRVSRRDVGTNMSKDEMRQMSQAVDLAALRAYRDAVGRRTREVAAAMTPDRWSHVYGAAEAADVAAAGTFVPEAQWVSDFWTGKSMAWFLYWVSAEHSVLHLSRAGMVRRLVRAGQG